MRRIPLALALVGAVAVTGCMGGAKSSATNDSGVQKGVTGSYYFVNLFNPPVGGIITSDVGGINCGASSAAVSPEIAPQTVGQATTGYQNGSTACTMVAPCTCTVTSPCRSPSPTCTSTTDGADPVEPLRADPVPVVPGDGGPDRHWAGQHSLRRMGR